MGFKLGLSGVLYYNSASTYATPTWAVADQARDVGVPLEDDEIEVDSRSSIFHLTAQGLRKTGIEWDMIYDPTQAFLKKVFNCYWNKTPLDMVALDEAIANTTARGWRMVGSILVSSKSEKLKEGQMITVNLKPTLQSTQHDPSPVKSDGSNIVVWDFT